jgi:4-alpha-glucanotransferase
MWSDPKSRADHLFWAWLQRALDVQFGAAAKAVADSGIMLKGDLPILMNDDSHDVWAHGEIFVQDLSAGAPPDMYSPDGQNWGFPLYNWEAHEKDDYAWWKQRLAVAEKYYGAYRIDHVLGFFRIWAASKGDYSSALGRYVPYRHIATYELAKMGFDKGRIRWLSQPHIPTSEVYDAIRAATSIEDEINNAAGQVFSKALDRIGNEELWLFKPTVKGEKDIHVMGLHGAAVSYLLKAWQNRLLLEYEDGKFCPTWRYRESRAYQTLSDAERQLLEMLLEQHTVKSEKIWESQGMRLLSVLAKSSEMLPCAEDLGAVPPCVPKVLTKLNILGLRVLRWHRRWDLNSNPYIPFRSYPELSVCTPAVHDSSTVREWWEREADQDQLSAFIGVPSMPKIYNPGAAKAILSKTASAASRFRVFQFQDLLHLSNRWYDRDPEAERINVPGTNNEFNWTYRFPAPIAEIGGDAGLVGAIAELAGIGAAK